MIVYERNCRAHSSDEDARHFVEKKRHVLVILALCDIVGVDSFLRGEIGILSFKFRNERIVLGKICDSVFLILGIRVRHVAYDLPFNRFVGGFFGENLDADVIVDIDVCRVRQRNL